MCDGFEMYGAGWYPRTFGRPARGGATVAWGTVRGFSMFPMLLRSRDGDGYTDAIGVCLICGIGVPDDIGTVAVFGAVAT